MNFPLFTRTASRFPRLDRSVSALTSPSRTKVCSWLAAASLATCPAFCPTADAIVTFAFDFADPAGTGFNDPAHPEYKAGLIDAGQTMGAFFAHTATVTMRVTSMNDPNSSTLASAGSEVIDPAGGSAGFFPTVAQAKVISNGATDLNGAAADGEVNVNLGASYEYNPNVPIAADRLDFKSTIIHELTHAFGFSSNFSQNPDTTNPGFYSIFDSFLTTASGAPLISPTTFIFKAGKVSTLTGGNNDLQTTPGPGGEFFNGQNARAAFGAPVPIFSPNPYQEGSSGSHVDDNTTATKPFLMAAATESGPKMMGLTGERAYSATENGMMTDLGFTLAASHASLFAGEAALPNGVYYLAFANGNPFGYYSYLSDPRYIYHFDLGYEYVFEAADGKSGAYLYDFKSGGFFYTSPTFPFPYMYDFALNSVVYYYPDPNNAGRYNTNGIRYFYVFNSGKIISK